MRSGTDVTRRGMVTGWSIGLWLLLILTLPGLAAAQAAPPEWSWEPRVTRVPNFEDKDEDENARLLVVEVLFRNKQATDQNLVVGPDRFQATTGDGKRVKVVGLLYRPGKLEGAKNLEHVGGRRKMKTMKEDHGDCTASYFFDADAIEVTVPGGKSYKQRLVLVKPAGDKPFRLKFGQLPELEIALPK